MANTIILKRSATQGNIPTTSQIELGEVAINTYDGKVYIKKSVSGTPTIVEVGPVVSVNATTGAVVLGSDEITEGSSNLYFTDARGRAAISAGTGISYNSTTGEIQTSQDITTAGSPSFAGLTLTGNAETLSLIPATDNVYSLGSATKAYADIYVGPGSLYINGKKAIEDDAGTMTFATDTDQDMRLASSGTGSVELLASGTGTVQMMGTLSLQSSKRIVDAAGVNVEFGNPIHMNSNKVTNMAEPASSTDGATKNYVDVSIANLVDSSPTALNTLNELAAALGDDANFSTTITSSIATKLNTADYTASDVLTKIKTVDGASSGLDSDLLDGSQGSFYLDGNNFINMPATGVTSVATSNGLTGGTITGTGTLSMSGSYTGTFNVTGEIKATGEVTAYFSDERLKKDIVPVTGALQGVMAMGGYTYKANDLAAELGVERTDNQIGLLAQEVEAQFPELVTESALAGYKTIRYDKMVTVLVEAMKEQQAMIVQLQADVKKTLH